MKFSNLNSHAQGFDIDKNGRIVLLAKYSGDTTNRIMVYNTFQNKDAVTPNKVFTPGREPTIDYDNDMIALISSRVENSIYKGGTCYIYKYSEYLKGNNVELYKFDFTPNAFEEYNSYYGKKVTSQNTNGFAIHNGYLYQLRGAFNGTMYIEAWNFLGGKSVKWNKINADANFFTSREAEGIKIYNDTIYIGSTTWHSRKYAEDFNYNIGYLK